MTREDRLVIERRISIIQEITEFSIFHDRYERRIGPIFGIRWSGSPRLRENDPATQCILGNHFAARGDGDESIAADELLKKSVPPLLSIFSSEIADGAVDWKVKGCRNDRSHWHCVTMFERISHWGRDLFYARKKYDKVPLHSLVIFVRRGRDTTSSVTRRESLLKTSGMSQYCDIERTMTLKIKRFSLLSGWLLIEAATDNSVCGFALANP